MLILTWWAFAMSAVLLAPTAVLVSATFADADPTLLTVATAVGLLAAVVQFLGLIRWPFAVPHLAREMADPTSSASKKDAVNVIFQMLNRYLGARSESTSATCSLGYGPVSWASLSSSPTCCMQLSAS
jgi:hypothetical protein